MRKTVVSQVNYVPAARNPVVQSACAQHSKFPSDRLRPVFLTAEATLQQVLSSQSGGLHRDQCLYRREKIHGTGDSRAIEDRAVKVHHPH